MGTSPALLQVIVDVTLALITGGMGVYLWLSKKSSINASHISRLEEDIKGKLQEQSERMVRVEEALENNHTATQSVTENQQKIHSRITQNGRDLSQLQGEFRAAKSTLGLIHQFLMGRSRD